MSIQVEPDELADALRVYRNAFLVTVGADARAHVTAVTPVLDGSVFTLHGLGRRTLDNLARNPAVTFLWPPREDGGHSLIVDGTAEGALLASADDSSEGAAVRVIISRAVLHRPAPAPAAKDSAGCAADCIELPTG
jgi:hypothetical protein